MTNELRRGLPPLPEKMRGLPIDKRGFPVPFFVKVIDGEPDHRIIDRDALNTCRRKRLCWICGQPLGVYLSFTVGPMCAVNRVSAEPPAHRDCARYSVQGCPFLSRPHAKRREAGMPTEVQVAPGHMIMRNPGVSLIWTTRSFSIYKTEIGAPGVIFDMGPAESMEWYAEGRPATLDEVEASIAAGLPSLIEQAQKDGEEGVRELHQAAERLRLDVRNQFA